MSCKKALGGISQKIPPTMPSCPEGSEIKSPQRDNKHKKIYNYIITNSNMTVLKVQPSGMLQYTRAPIQVH